MEKARRNQEKMEKQREKQRKKELEQQQKDGEKGNATEWGESSPFSVAPNLVASFWRKRQQVPGMNLLLLELHLRQSEVVNILFTQQVIPK